MQKYTLYLASLLVLMLCIQPARAQSNQFRDTRAHLGLGVGVFTYYGPIDLTEPETSSNHIRKSDPAVVLLGSFPIVGDRFYFRGMIGMTNFDTTNERTLVDEGKNEFLRKELFFFEPEVIYTLTPGSRSRFLPYIYTGFGGLLADPFRSADNNVNMPGSGIPGPERSVFTIPIGIGIDYAISPRFSFFIDASYRFDFNYVARNENAGRNPHNTSLVMGGIRIGIPSPFREEPVAAGPQVPIPDPIEIPPYEPAPPEKELPAPRCTLVELNTVYFAYNSATLDAEAREQLDANIEALRLNPECCIDIVGYTDTRGNSTYALRISRQRAEAVYQYYLDGGISRDRLHVRAEGTALPPCDKEDEGPGCRRNRRVESIPYDCDSFQRQLNQ